MAYKCSLYAGYEPVICISCVSFKAPPYMGLIATWMCIGNGLVAYGMAFIFDPIMWQMPAPIIWTVISVIGIVRALSGNKENDSNQES